MKNFSHLIYLTFILLFSLNFNSSVKAQSLKTYSGAYKLGYTNGIATYTFKEKDYKQTKHGSFTWKNSVSYRGDYGNETLKGSFNNGKVNGNWTHTTNMKQNGVTSKITATGNFKNNMPNGLFEYNATITNRNGSATINASVNYKMGQMVGNVYYKTSPKGGDNLITGKLNSNGFVIGEFKVHEKTYDDILRTNSKGVLEIVVSRNSGNVTYNKNYKEELTGVTESDMYYDTIQMPNDWYVGIMKLIWGDAAFYNLKFEGVPPSDELIGPKYLKGNKKGGLEASKLTPIAVWETFQNKLNNKNCIYESIVLHQNIALLDSLEKDMLQMNRDQILSAEIDLRDSVIQKDRILFKNIEEYYRLFNVLSNDYKSSKKSTTNQLMAFSEIENKIIELSNLKIGDTPLNNIRLDDSASSVLSGIMSFSETLNTINCPTIDELVDTSLSCKVKVSTSSIGILVNELESSIKKISSHEDNFSESLLKAYNANFLEDIKLLNEKYAFYTSTNGMRTAKFNENYKAIFSEIFTNVNGPNFAEVLSNGVSKAQEFNANIDKSLKELEKFNLELSVKFANINAKKELVDKYTAVINSWSKSPSSEISNFISKLDQLSKYQSLILAKTSEFESQKNLIQSKIEESKNIASLSGKLTIIYDSWWLNDDHKNADLATNLNQLISLQSKLINIIADKDKTKSVAKELKKVDDAAVILETLNR